MTIYFRVSTDPSSGRGHIVRSVHLAKELIRLRERVIFLLDTVDDFVTDLISNAGAGLIYLDLSSELVNKEHLVEDATKSAKYLSSSRDAMVVDHYRLGHEWQDVVMKEAGKLIVIEDRHWVRHSADLVIYGGLFSASQVGTVYEAMPRTRVAIGPEFLILPPVQSTQETSFLTQGKKRRSDMSCLIYLSWDYNFELMFDICSVVACHGGFKRVEVIFGIHFERHDEIKGLFGSAVEFVAAVWADDIELTLSKSDVLVSGAGSIVWHRCLAGLSGIVFELEPNQNAIAENLDVFGAHLNLGKVSGEAMMRLASTLQELKDEDFYIMRQRAVKVCDRQGAKRSAERILATMSEETQ